MISDLLNIDLFKEFGLDALPEEQQQALTEQMTDVVESRLNRKLISLLSDEQKTALDGVLSQGGDVVAFLKAAIPNIDIVTAEVIADFKQEMLDISDTVKQAVAAQRTVPSA